MNPLYAMMDAQKRMIEFIFSPYTMWIDYMVDQSMRQFK